MHEKRIYLAFDVDPRILFTGVDRSYWLSIDVLDALEIDLGPSESNTDNSGDESESSAGLEIVGEARMTGKFWEDLILEVFNLILELLDLPTDAGNESKGIATDSTSCKVEIGSFLKTSKYLNLE
jgi:hypothetical protein